MAIECVSDSSLSTFSPASCLINVVLPAFPRPTISSFNSRNGRPFQLVTQNSNEAPRPQAFSRCFQGDLVLDCHSAIFLRAVASAASPVTPRVDSLLATTVLGF